MEESGNLNGKKIKDYCHRNKFNTIDEFKWSIKQGTETTFLYNNKEYFISGCLDKNRPFFAQNNCDDIGRYFDSVEQLLNNVIDGKKLRDIIKDVKVIDRTI